MQLQKQTLNIYLSLYFLTLHQAPPYVRRSKSKMEVIFERSGSNPFTMKIDLFDTVPEIKERIQRHHGIPISDQTLIFENTVLSDDFEILLSNIIEQSRIHLVVASDPASPPKKTCRASTSEPPPPKNEFRVVVVYEGKKIPVEVGREERVAELRKKLEKMKVKLPEEGCFFIHKQDLMEDEETFRWHRVNEGDAIDMFGGRVTGGS